MFSFSYMNTIHMTLCRELCRTLFLLNYGPSRSCAFPKVIPQIALHVVEIGFWCYLVTYVLPFLLPVNASVVLNL